MSAGVSRAGESRLGGELGGDIPRREEVEQGVPRLGRKAELEGVDHLRGNAALLDDLASRFAMSRIEENVVEPHGGELVDLNEPLLLFLFLRRPCSAHLQLDPRAGGQLLQRFSELDVLHEHVEREDVAALPAPEAVEVLGVGEDDERGRLLVVERAQALEIRTGLFQGRHISLDQIDNVDPVPDFSDGISGHGSIQSTGPAQRGCAVFGTARSRTGQSSMRRNRRRGVRPGHPDAR